MIWTSLLRFYQAKIRTLILRDVCKPRQIPSSGSEWMALSNLETIVICTQFFFFLAGKIWWVSRAVSQWLFWLSLHSVEVSWTWSSGISMPPSCSLPTLLLTKKRPKFCHTCLAFGKGERYHQKSSGFLFSKKHLSPKFAFQLIVLLSRSNFPFSCDLRSLSFHLVILDFL